MSDLFNDARQEFEFEFGATTNTVINEGDLSLIDNSGTSEANNLIRLVENTETGVKNVYILQTVEDGEIRFLTKDAYLNNDISAQDGNLFYNVKIGSDGKLYCYYTFDFFNNPTKISGWYDITNELIGQDFSITRLDVEVVGITSALGIVGLNIESLQTITGINTSGISSLGLRVSNLEAIGNVGEISLNQSTQEDIDDALRTLSDGIAQFEEAGSIPTQLQVMTSTSVYAWLAQGVLNNALGAIGAIGFGIVVISGIRAILDNQKKQQYKDEMLGLTDILSKISISTTEDKLIHTGIIIESGNSGFSTTGTYRITIQREAVLIIYINSSLVASVVNVEQFGTSTFELYSEFISIPKSSLGGGTGDPYLILSINQLGTLKTWTELRATYLQEKINGIDTKQRRKEGVIGADDIDTTQFTTTNITYTNTTEPEAETITYKQLKSRLNLLPTGTSDVDIYTSTGKVGIGTTPAPYIPLHIYHATDSVARIQSGTSGISQIQFIRGVEADSLIDYRFVNDANLFRLQFQDGATATQFGDGNSFLVDVSTTNTRFYKNLQVSGRVGINTAPHATITNDVNGTSRFVGNVGIGIIPNALTLKLDVNGTARFTDNVGIGTAPAISTDIHKPNLKIYSTSDTSAYIRGGATGSASLEIAVGDLDDTKADWRFINRDGILSVEYQNNIDTYGGAGTELMYFKPEGVSFPKKVNFDTYVGIGNSADEEHNLFVDGYAKIATGNLYITDGSVGIGTTEPNTKLHIQSTTNDTRLTIEDMDATANGLPADIVFPDGDYASTVVVGSSTDKWVYINNSIISSNKTTRFTVLQRMEVDLLLVGGGGAGGHNVGGGGGGGGIFYGKNIILEAGNYKIVVGRGGIGQIGQTTVRLASANGEPTYLCYDGKYQTPVKFNLGGTMREAIGLGGGSGATAVSGSFASYRGHNGGSGGGSSEGAANAYLANNGGTALQPATFWNGTAYEVGGTNGRANTDTAIDFRGGGGGGGTASAPVMTNSYTCGKRTVQVTFADGISYSLSGGGGSVAFAPTDLTATEGLGGANPSGSVFGGFGAFYNSGNATLSPASNGVDNSGSGGGGSGINTAGGLWTKAGNGGTGIAMIRYRLAERKNSSSLDLFRNNSTLTGYSVGNYEGQFKIQKQNQTTPAILVNPIQNVSIGSRYAPQIFSVGNKGGRLRIANDNQDYTEIGVNDDSTPPCIRMMGNSRTDGKQGNIEYECNGTGKHTFTGEGVFTGYVKSKSDALHAVANHALYNFPANNLLTSLPTQGWETRLVNTSSWDGGGFYPQTAGIYFVSATCYMTNSNHSFSIRLNATSATTGTEYAVGNGPAGFSATATAIIRLLTTDNITLWAGANGCGITNNPRSSLSIYLLMGE